MLTKLIKYEAKPLFKVLGIFYSLALFFALLARILFSVENSLFVNILAHICSGVTISMIINIIINNLLPVWVFFKQSMYGDESYLLHTLPVKRSTHLAAKTLTSLLTLFCSIIVIVGAVLTAYYNKENLELIKKLLFPVSEFLGISIGEIILLLSVLLFLEFFSALQCGFCGIILGHRLENYKTLFSIVFGLVTYLITQAIAVAAAVAVSPFNQGIKSIIFNSNAVSPEGFKALAILMIIVYAIISAAEYIINQKLFSRGVNVI